jgi:hypothetical protein
MAEKPAWQRYLELSRVETKSPFEGFGSKSIGSTPKGLESYFEPTPTELQQRLANEQNLERAIKQYEGTKLVGEAIGAEPEQRKGILSNFLDFITFVPSVATAGVKEFIVDPFVGGDEKVSLEEFKKNVKERNFAQEMYGFLEYGKDAPIWEKALKEIGGLGIDIASTGGFGTGIRFASTLGRKVATKQLDNASADLFKKTKTKLPDETELEFSTRAIDFGARVANAQIKGRSRGVLNEFKKEFGKNAEELFSQLPKELQGGIRLFARGKAVASFNAGGRVTDAIAKRLNIPQLTDTTEKAVKAYQNTINTLRGDQLKIPGVAVFVGKINKALNNISGERSKVWGSYVSAVAQNAKDEDLINAYKSFRAVDEITNFRNLRTAVVKPTNGLLDDILRLKKQSPEEYDRAIDYMINPQKVLLANANDIQNDTALNFANRYRDEFNRFQLELVDAGYDVGYLNEYLPVFFAKPENQEKIIAFLTQGPKGIVGQGYRPDIARKQFLKDRIDPITKQVIRRADGSVEQVPMTPSEIKDELIKRGRKDLAALIEDDPLVLLARYANNVSRLVATKKLVTSLRARGVLVKSTAMQLSPDTEAFELAAKQLSPDELNKIRDNFLSEPGGLSKWLENVNDDLATALSTNDKVAIDRVMGEVKNFVDSLQDIQGSFKDKLKLLRKDKKKLEKEVDKLQTQAPNLYPDQTLLYEAVDKKAQLKQLEDEILDQAALRDTIKKDKLTILRQMAGKDVYTGDGKSRILGDRLNDNLGIEYIPVGASEFAQNSTFYLQKELAELTGEKELVNILDRFITVQAPRKGSKETQDFLQSIDQYLQFFRAGATFGRLTGFVLRNGYGAIQNNFIIAGSTAVDHKIAKEIAQARVFTDYALQPFAQLTSKDKSSKRLDNLINKGRLTENQAKLLRDDIDKYGFVQAQTVSDLREDILENLLKGKYVTDDITYHDVYKTALDSGIYDRYVILPASQGLNADDAAVTLIGQDPSKIVVRTDRIGRERKGTQKLMEGILNIGPTISADVAGRKINLKPVQLTRDLNQVLEEFVRTAPLVTGLRKYGKTDGGANSAIMLMKAAQFDYSDLSDLERRILRRALPFYTYMKNNISAQMRVLLNDPERIRRNLAFWEAVGDIFTGENGENYVLPDYIGEMYGFLIDDNLRKDLLKKSPWWLKELLQNPLAFRPESPVLDLERYSRGGISMAGVENIFQEGISSSNPLGKAIVQVMMKENLFTGREYTNEDDAPNWYVAIDKLLGNKLGVKVNEKGENVAPGMFIDLFKTIIPQIGTAERSALPLMDAVLEIVTGEPSDLGSTMSERAITNLLSQLGGINVVTITPEVEQGVYVKMRENINNAIDAIALDKQIDRKKLRDYVYSFRDAGYTTEEIVNRIEQLRQEGYLAPEYLTQGVE